MIARLGALALALFATGAASAPPQVDHPRHAVRADELVGTWRLASWRLVGADGTVRYPFTDHATGRISYDRRGWMTVFLMHPDWASAGREGGFIAYAGRFTVADGVVRHHVDASSLRHMIGTVQVRRASIAGRRLRLEAAADDDPASRHVLEWVRSEG